MKKILFTGGSGLLATNWALQLRGRYETVNGLHQRQVTIPGIATAMIDMESVDGFRMAIDTHLPDIVIHCASMTTVEGCEANPAMAQYTNVDVTVHAAQACSNKGVRFVYISTDHLFNGKQPLVTEDTPVLPLNVYGKTKAEAEAAALSFSGDTLSIRTNFYGWGTSYRHSFSDSILQALQNGQEIRLFEDVFYTPILIHTLAETAMKLIEKNAGGIYNVVSTERISKHEFGLRVAKEFGYDPSLVKAARFAERTDLVQRPLDLSLSNRKAAEMTGGDFGFINTEIRALLEQQRSGYAALLQNV